MFELNGEIFYKVFEVGKIPSYMDPAKKYNESYIQQVALNYDPVNIHEAPFWVGHPDWRSEPKAGGWVKKLAAIGKELYASFGEMSDWLKELYNNGEFKKCSVEMGDLEIDSNGTVIPYLWAIGATNIPAVKGLPVLKFSDEAKLKNKVCFSLMNFIVDANTKNNYNSNNSNMESIKKLASNIGLTLSGSETEAELLAAIENKVKEIRASEAETVKALSEFKDASAKKLVDDAVASGKIKPAEKDNFLAFAKSQYEACSKIFASMQDKGLTEDSRFRTTQNSSGHTPALSNVTYEDVIREPQKFIGMLKDEDIMRLKKESLKFADTKID